MQLTLTDGDKESLANLAHNLVLNGIVYADQSSKPGATPIDSSVPATTSCEDCSTDQHLQQAFEARRLDAEQPQPTPVSNRAYL